MTVQMVRNPFLVPVADPMPGTLLSLVTPTEGETWLEPYGLHESFNCLRLDSEPVWPCPVATLAAPTTSAAGTATTGGTLPAATYRAKIVAVNSRGTTLPGTERSQATTGSASTATFNWTDLSGETAYRVYLTNGAANSEDRYVEVAAGSTSYVLTAWPPSGAVTGTVPTENTAVVPATKDFSDPHWEDGFRFAVYGGIECKAIGRDPATQDQLRRVFLNNESVAVERAVMKTRFAANADTAIWDKAPDLTPTPGTAVDVSVGVALLEGDAAANYAGLPTLHVPRAIGTLMFSRRLAERKGDRFYTPQGAKVASGGGYGDPNLSPTGTAPAANAMWIYASGEVQMARGALIEHEELNRSSNLVTAMVERVYTATVDCYTAAVLVKVATE